MLISDYRDESVTICQPTKEAVTLPPQATRSSHPAPNRERMPSVQLDDVAMADLELLLDGVRLPWAVLGDRWVQGTRPGPTGDQPVGVRLDADVAVAALEAGGLVAGTDFHLAFSPERIDPGNEKFGAKNTPKVVGGHTPACAEAAAGFYGAFVDTVVRAKGTREAETAKLLENTYRHINIALVNEMARFCHELGIDLWDVIEAASSKPFGFQAFYPGPGVGGHCIPIDPNYLSHNVRARLGYPFRFVELAQEINSGMPAYVVSRAQDLLNDEGKALKGSTVLLLGVTYKPNIADQRESPAVPLAKNLAAKGAVVRYHDPHVSDWRAVPDAQRVQDPAAGAAQADLTILVQNHREYDVQALSSAARLFFDTRGKAAEGEKVHRL